MLNGVNLASFSLVDCAQTLLGQRLEVVPPRCMAAWAHIPNTPPHKYTPVPFYVLGFRLYQGFGSGFLFHTPLSLFTPPVLCPSRLLQLAAAKLFMLLASPLVTSFVAVHMPSWLTSDQVKIAL